MRRILDRIVAGGYNVYPEAYATIPDLEAARQAIIAGGDQIIDVFGVASGKKRQEKSVNRIVINLRKTDLGSVAYSGDSYYRQTNVAPNKYERVKVDGGTFRLTYDVRTVTESVEYDRICFDAIIGGLTNHRRYLSAMDRDTITYNDERTFLIEHKGDTDVKGMRYFERIYTFEVIDVYIGSYDETVVTTDIPELTEITADGIVQKDGVDEQTIQDMIKED